jgi:aspartate/methionine/tyrosine aminotransferase
VPASFPLAEWIDRHRSTALHDLASSGMRGSLASVRRALRSPRPGTESEVAAQLAESHDVDPARVFLTHGATEANSFALFFLSRELRRALGRAPRARIPVPEYPPLAETARLAGFRRRENEEAAELAILSDPNNPTGRLWTDEAFEGWADGTSAVLVDETFREFTPARSRVIAGRSGLWVTGSFTKVYGADEIRVGYAIAPETHRGAFSRFFGVLRDPLAETSVAAARAILGRRREILAESRGLFRRNVRILRRQFPAVGELDAPVWFDRGDSGLDGEALASAALASGVLVCSGAFFGDPRGVRICLTRRSFSDDLRAYREVRDAFRARAQRNPRARARPQRPAHASPARGSPELALRSGREWGSGERGPSVRASEPFSRTGSTRDRDDP